MLIRVCGRFSGVSSGWVGSAGVEMSRGMVMLFPQEGKLAWKAFAARRAGESEAGEISGLLSKASRLRRNGGRIVWRINWGMEPTVGFEPTTYGLQNHCSTAELCRRWC